MPLRPCKLAHFYRPAGDARYPPEAWVEGLTEGDLDQPIKDVPPQFELLFGTWRNSLMLRAIHWMQHYGQLTDNRKAAGRPPLIF